MIEKIITYSNYYRFKAKLIVVPVSYNRVGIDPYPKYHLRPTELLEVMLFSEDPRSVDNDFTKDKESGLYLKNREDVDVEGLDAQFDFMKMTPPFWWYNQDTYEEWVKGTMSPMYTAKLEARYHQTQGPATLVKEEEDPEFAPEHLYKIITTFTTRTFNKNSVGAWPSQKNASIFKMGTPPTTATSTTNTPTTTGGTSGGY